MQTGVSLQIANLKLSEAEFCAVVSRILRTGQKYRGQNAHRILNCARVETRRAGATAAPRQDEGERGDGDDADGGEAAGDREEHRCSVSGLSCRSGAKECRVARRW